MISGSYSTITVAYSSLYHRMFCCSEQRSHLSRYEEIIDFFSICPMGIVTWVDGIWVYGWTYLHLLFILLSRNYYHVIARLFCFLLTMRWNKKKFSIMKYILIPLRALLDIGKDKVFSAQRVFNELRFMIHWANKILKRSVQRRESGGKSSRETQMWRQFGQSLLLTSHSFMH